MGIRSSKSLHNESEEWINLAQKFKEDNNLKDSRICYREAAELENKAYQSHPSTDYRILETLCTSTANLYYYAGDLVKSRIILQEYQSREDIPEDNKKQVLKSIKKLFNEQIDNLEKILHIKDSIETLPEKNKLKEHLPLVYTLGATIQEEISRLIVDDEELSNTFLACALDLYQKGNSSQDLKRLRNYLRV